MTLKNAAGLVSNCYDVRQYVCSGGSGGHIIRTQDSEATLTVRCSTPQESKQGRAEGDLARIRGRSTSEFGYIHHVCTHDSYCKWCTGAVRISAALVNTTGVPAVCLLT